MEEHVETGSPEYAKALLAGEGCDLCKYCGGFNDHDIKGCWQTGKWVKLPEERVC